MNSKTPGIEGMPRSARRVSSLTCSHAPDLGCADMMMMKKN